VESMPGVIKSLKIRALIHLLLWQTFWRRSEREEKQQKKVKDRQAQEQRRLDIELLEAKRQQRKLNFLITQTELYAHFMARKMAAGATVAPNSSATISEAAEILNRLNSDVSEERVRQLDDYDEAAVKEEALCAATLAAQRQEANRIAYERQVRELGLK
jgi:DNA helicase INO80